MYTVSLETCIHTGSELEGAPSLPAARAIQASLERRRDQLLRLTWSKPNSSKHEGLNAQRAAPVHASINLLTSRTSAPWPQQVENSAFYLPWQSNSHSSMHLSGRHWPRGQHQLCYSCLRYTFADISVYTSYWHLREAHAYSGPNAM